MNVISTLVKVSLKFGAIAAALGSVFVIVLYYIGKHPLLFPIYFDFRIILFLIFIFFALKEYRDYDHGGVLYFWEGVIGSFVLVLTYALIVSLVIYGFGLIEKDFVQSFVQLFTAQVKQFPADVVKQIGKKEFDEYVAQISSVGSADLAFNYFKQSFIISFFITIVLSVILRRQPKN